MTHLRNYVFPAAALLLAGACTSLLGDEFEIADGAGGSGTGATGGSGGATTGSTSTTSAGGSGGSTSTGSGGTGGGGGCVLGTTDGCEANAKCSVLDVNTGAVGCVGAGTQPAYSACAADSQCEAGTWCDLIVEVCRPVCVSSSCANGGTCIPAEDGVTNIPGLFVCTSNCEPDQASPCVQDHGPVTCARTSEGWDCVMSADHAAGTSCGSDRDCSPGLICTSSGTCWEWCRVGENSTCTTGMGSHCSSLDPQEFHENVEFGTCIIT